MNYYYLMLRKGMTGGTARGVFKMLCHTPEWHNGLAQGAVDFAAVGVLTHSICWSLEEATNDNNAAVRTADINKQSQKDGYDAFFISIEEAMRIEKGEEVTDSPGAILPETVTKIQEAIKKITDAGGESPAITLSREEFEKATQPKKQE